MENNGLISIKRIQHIIDESKRRNISSADLSRMLVVYIDFSIIEKLYKNSLFEICYFDKDKQLNEIYCEPDANGIRNLNSENPLFTTLMDILKILPKKVMIDTFARGDFEAEYYSKENVTPENNILLNDFLKVIPSHSQYSTMKNLTFPCFEVGYKLIGSTNLDDESNIAYHTFCNSIEEGNAFLRSALLSNVKVDMFLNNPLVTLIDIIEH